jgi:putative transposase
VTLDTSFCLAALERALRGTKPTIFNTDQGGQFTSQVFTGRLLADGVHISMDGRGRALDHVFVERLWRSVKYEVVVRREAVATIAALSQHAQDAACCSIRSTLRSTAAR